ncbi:hypothetical protein QQ045_007608 [Rhodiola kirilowii]
MENTDQGESSDKSNMKSFWKLPLPRKIKIFIWRGFHKALPTGKQLWKRNLSNNLSCPICNLKLEGDIHIFNECWWSKCLWDQLKIRGSHFFHNFSSFADLIYFCKNNLHPAELSKTIVALWYIWYIRNTAAHQSKIMSPQLASQSITALWSQYLKYSSDLLDCLQPGGP